MRSLTLIRHAKSDWSAPAQGDHDRPLNARGCRDAPEMGRRLRKRGLRFDLVITSDACRALETIAAIREEMGEKAAGRLEIEPGLYLCTTSGLIEFLLGLDDEIRRIALVGHNPGMTGLAQALGAELDNLPTCGIVTFEWQDLPSWRDVTRKKADRIGVDLPKVPYRS